MKRCGRTAQSPLYLSLSVLNIYTQNRLQVNAQTKKMNQKILLREKEGEVKRKWEGSRPSCSLLFPTDGRMEGEERRGVVASDKRYPRDGEM